MDWETIKAFFTSLTLTKITPALIIFVVSYFVIRALTKLFDRVIAKSKAEKSVHGFLRQAFRILLISIAILMIVSSLGVDVSSMIAVLSVASLAISLAVQGALSNVAGGIMILTTHPFHVGDWIEVGTVSGTVHEIGMSYTTLLTADLKQISVPNSEISTSKIINYTITGQRRLELTFTASYNDAVEDVKMAILKAAMLPMVQMEPVPFVAVSKYGETTIEYVLRVWTATADYWDAYYSIMEHVKVCFDEAGIQMTDPHLYVQWRPEKDTSHPS